MPLRCHTVIETLQGPVRQQDTSIVHCDVSHPARNKQQSHRQQRVGLLHASRIFEPRLRCRKDQHGVRCAGNGRFAAMRSDQDATDARSIEYHALDTDSLRFEIGREQGIKPKRFSYFFDLNLNSLNTLGPDFTSCPFSVHNGNYTRGSI